MTTTKEEEEEEEEEEVEQAYTNMTSLTDLHTLQHVLKVTVSTRMRRAIDALHQPVNGAVVDFHELRGGGGAGRVERTVADEEKGV